MIPTRGSAPGERGQRPDTARLSYRRQGSYFALERRGRARLTQVPFPLSLLLSHPEPIEGYVGVGHADISAAKVGPLIMVFGYNITRVTSI